MRKIKSIELDFTPVKLTFAQDGKHFLVLGEDRIISLNVDGIQDGVTIEALRVMDADYIDNTHLVVLMISNEGFQMAVIELTTGRIIASITDNNIRSICADPTHQRIFAGHMQDGIAIYDLSLHRVAQYELPRFHMPLSLSISQRGDRLVVAGLYFCLWDITSEPRLISKECPEEDDCTGTPCEVTSGTVTPDGRFAAAGFHGAKGVCAVMDGITGQIHRWYGPKGDETNYYETAALALSPDGQYVAVRLNGSTKLQFFNVVGGTTAFVHDVNRAGCITFSPIANVLAVCCENSITLWQV